MSLDSDVIVDRRRIRRKLTFWRVVAALLAIAAVVIIATIATPGGRGASVGGTAVQLNAADDLRGDDGECWACSECLAATGGGECELPHLSGAYSGRGAGAADEGVRGPKGGGAASQLGAEAER